MTAILPFANRLNVVEVYLLFALLGAGVFLLIAVVELAGFYLVAAIRRWRARREYRRWSDQMDAQADRNRRLLDSIARYRRVR